MNLAYDDRGTGDPVLFIAGRGGAGRTWHLYQVPDFQRAGYRTVTFDNRGIGATAQATGFGIEQIHGVHGGRIRETRADEAFDAHPNGFEAAHKTHSNMAEELLEIQFHDSNCV